MVFFNKIKDKLSYAVIVAQGVELENPLGAQTFEELVTNVVIWIQRIAIPIAVIFIVWAGIKFVTAQGNPEKIGEAKKMLFWTLIGLAIIFIGGGFVSLIQSILSL